MANLFNPFNPRFRRLDVAVSGAAEMLHQLGRAHLAIAHVGFVEDSMKVFEPDSEERAKLIELIDGIRDSLALVHDSVKKRRYELDRQIDEL